MEWCGLEETLKATAIQFQHPAMCRDTSHLTTGASQHPCPSSDGNGPHQGLKVALFRQ